MQLCSAPTKPADVRALVVRQSQRKQIANTLMNEIYPAAVLRTHARTIVGPGFVPLAIFGVDKRAGEWYGWGMLTDEVLKFPLQLTKMTRLMLEYAHRVHRFDEVRIFVDPKNDSAKNWAEVLGFTDDGFLRAGWASMSRRWV